MMFIEPFEPLKRMLWLSLSMRNSADLLLTLLIFAFLLDFPVSFDMTRNMM